MSERHVKVLLNAAQRIESQKNVYTCIAVLYVADEYRDEKNQIIANIYKRIAPCTDIEGWLYSECGVPDYLRTVSNMREYRLRFIRKCLIPYWAKKP